MTHRRCALKPTALDPHAQQPIFQHLQRCILLRSANNCQLVKTVEANRTCISPSLVKQFGEMLALWHPSHCFFRRSRSFMQACPKCWGPYWLHRRDPGTWGLASSAGMSKYPACWSSFPRSWRNRASFWNVSNPRNTPTASHFASLKANTSGSVCLAEENASCHGRVGSGMERSTVWMKMSREGEGSHNSEPLERSEDSAAEASPQTGLRRLSLLGQVSHCPCSDICTPSTTGNHVFLLGSRMRHKRLPVVLCFAWHDPTLFFCPWDYKPHRSLTIVIG